MDDCVHAARQRSASSEAELLPMDMCGRHAQALQRAGRGVHHLRWPALENLAPLDVRAHLHVCVCGRSRKCTGQSLNSDRHHLVTTTVSRGNKRSNTSLRITAKKHTHLAMLTKTRQFCGSPVCATHVSEQAYLLEIRQPCTHSTHTN